MPRKTTRIGNQTPTKSFVLPYEKTKGASSVRIYQSTGRKAQEWQKLLIYDMLAVNDDGLWTHSKFGYALPRRNGKNEVLIMRELYGLKHGEHILHTAHRTSTAHSAWERLLDAVTKTNMIITSSYRAFGREHIEVEGGGKIEFRTRSAQSGLGEGYDLLIIDEAQAYTADQETALKYVVSSSPNPQTIFLGTPPTVVSAGTIFPNMRKNALSGKAKNTAWEEWSIDAMTDPENVEAWYMTNPSLGSILTERKIEDEIGTDDAARLDFNIQRLGLWMQNNLRSAISEREWKDLTVPTLPKLTGKMYVGIKYAHDGESVAMSIAVRTKEDKTFIETIDCRSVRAGTAWIILFLTDAEPAIKKVVVDGANGQQLLYEKMKENKLKAPVMPTVKNIIAANAGFEQAIFQGKICHMAQPSLGQSVTNVEKRAIGSNGGFGYQSIRDGIDVSLLDSAILAYWASVEFKETAQKQTIKI